MVEGGFLKDIPGIFPVSGVYGGGIESMDGVTSPSKFDQKVVILGQLKKI